ncbi:hypothetical protein KAJ83_18700 [Marivibrio halodurans]|uniref:Uncharacterized protein n=1 Tax=Marivibrio halodurans TaxID=2039722 RepID=A0A8J7SBN3_9PROT|nr:hypothetical protein [Marivibrio halodurans]MBP5859057.1 hypothetical protein [Marivibrio halodurans]
MSFLTRVNSPFRPSVNTRLRGTSRRWRAGIAALAMIGIGAGAAQANCLQGIESGTYAKSVRTLQSDMMVAALSCNARALYNNFAVSYRPDLMKHGKALKSYFQAVHGGASTRELNAYVTELANDASIRHARTGSAFCEAAEGVFADLIGTENQHVELGTYALRYAIAVRPQLAQEIATASGTGVDGAACDELVALNGPVTE